MKKLLIILIFISLSFAVFSQIDYYEQPENKPDTSILERKYLYGLDVGLGFGTYTRILLSPKIAYPITPWFTAGLGADFMYFSYSGFQSMMYGANAFSELFILKAGILHFEYTKLNVYYDWLTDREWNTAMYAGIGYRQMLSKKMYVSYIFQNFILLSKIKI